MASLKYFLLCPFVFLCLSYTFANGVFNSIDGSGFGPRAGPIPDPSAGPGVDRWVSNVGAGPRVEGGVSNVGIGPKVGPKAGPGHKLGISNVDAGPKAGPGSKLGVGGIGAGPRAGPKGVDSIVNGVEVGVGVGYRPGVGLPGFGPIPGVGLPGFGPIHGGRWPGQRIEPYDDCMLGYVCPECSKFEFGTCDSYNFRPLSATMDLHKVNINWAKSKPVATAQHGESGPAIHIDSAH